MTFIYRFSSALVQVFTNEVENNPQSEDEKENQNDLDSDDSSSSDSPYQLDFDTYILNKLKNCTLGKNSKIEEEKPKANFDDTVYMKHYSKLETKRPPLSEWVEGLYKIFPYLKSEIQNCIEGSKDDDEPVIRIWTWSTIITRAINLALMMDAYNTFDLKEIDVKYVESQLKKMKLDYKEVIENSIKFIRRVNTVLIDVCTLDNTEDRKVYRGVNTKVFSNVKVGDEFRIVNFLWASDNKFMAEQFSLPTSSDQQTTILTIEIPKHCCNAGKIGCYSMFSSEKETLIPPYTSYKLVSKDGENMHLYVAQDNLFAPFDKYSF
jgi:hypothetical protein